MLWPSEKHYGSITGMARTRIALTDTFCRSGIEKHLRSHGKSLDEPHEIRDAQIIGLLIRRQPSGAKLWYFAYTIGGRRGRIAIGSFPKLSVDGARRAAKLHAAAVAHGRD